MKSILDIMDYVGDEAIMAAMDVGADSIRKARKADKLPAAWYDGLERMAGRPLPRKLFSFKGAAE